MNTLRRHPGPGRSPARREAREDRALARPDPDPVRDGDLRLHRHGRDRHRHLVVLGQLAPRPARRRCGRPGRRGPAADESERCHRAGQGRGEEERLRRRLAAISVSPVQDPPVTGRRLVVTVSAPVDMFFMRIFGINSITAQPNIQGGVRPARPDGQPGELVRRLRPDPRTCERTRPRRRPASRRPTWPGDSGSSRSRRRRLHQQRPSGRALPTSGWTLITAVGTEDTAYAQTLTTTSTNSGVTSTCSAALAADETATTVSRIEVDLADVHLSATCAASSIRVALSLGRAAQAGPRTSRDPYQRGT